MGLFDSSKEKEAKKVSKEVQQNIGEKGLSNLVNEADLLKIIVEQNECLIQLAANNAISNAGMIGDSLVITSTSMYYNNIKQYFKE
jgi:hypothetical protein